MLYRTLLFPARIFFRFYCRKIVVNNKDILRSSGPLLIAANHPNSFLDAIIIATLFKKPVYSLARGDVFLNKTVKIILRSLNMLPVYRLSEGAENLEHNYTTFDSCLEIFKQNGIVLIFSEGRSINEWRLRPLKKGTARLAMAAWQQGIHLTIIPAGINYNHFRKFGKIIFLNFGNRITKEKITADLSNGKAIVEFNNILKNELQQLVVEMDSNDEQLKKIFHLHQPVLKKILLFIPAIMGYILHLPLYIAIHSYIKNRAEDHYDSIMIGLLFFMYPVYIIIIALIIYFITHSILLSLSAIILLPVTAFCALQNCYA